MLVIKISKVFSKLFSAIALWPFIFVTQSNQKNNPILLNHEKIHLKQQLELLIIPFYIWYLGEFLFRLFQYKNSYLAYKNISFEKEAYANEKQLNYLKKRALWNFWRYL